MNIGIIGMGVVGKAIHNSLRHIDIIAVYDPRLGYLDKEALFDTEACFICVPTPTKEGEQDISILEETLLFLYGYTGLIIIKSTTTPNNLEKLVDRFKDLNIMHAPEFLDQNKPYFEQMMHIMGVKDIYQAMLYRKIYETYLDNSFRTTNLKTAAMMKYTHNVYGALKVTFFNEIKDACDKIGVDYREMVGGMLQATDHISRCYTRMGVDGQRGFGGACFPKDVVAFVNEFEMHTLEAAIGKNYKYRKKEMGEVLS